MVMTMPRSRDHALPGESTEPLGAQEEPPRPYRPEDAGLANFYPGNETEHGKLLGWCQSSFLAAERQRMDHQRRWERYYRHYRSFVQRRKGDWRSKVFYPISFYVVEAITPRLVSSLPKFLALPMGPEDVDPAKAMSVLLNWAATQSETYVELVKAVKSMLKYGTGILKTYQRVIEGRQRIPQPTQRPQYGRTRRPAIDPDTGAPMQDINGQPIYEDHEVFLGYQEGPPIWTAQPYTIYEGPACKAVDIFNFYPAPEADDLDSARYVIHRTWQEMSYIQRLADEGVYRLPNNFTPSDLADTSQEPNLYRLSQVQLGQTSDDPTRRPVELLEFWTNDGRVITMANRKAILRAHENPFDHGEKPFCRIVDYLAEHEFWGIGEIEPIEGLQDLINAIANQRIDNIRLVLNSMFGVNTKYIEDLRDLQVRPGGVIRFKDDLPIRDVFQRVDLGDVTPRAFEETAMAEAVIEKVTSVSAYQLGTPSDHLNRTATGVSLLQEMGGQRFELKTRLSELMGLRRLGRQFGSLLQQFITEPKVVRLLGPDGETLFQTFDPAALMGAFDYDIEPASLAQTKAEERASAMNLLQGLAPLLPQAIPALAQDLLEAYERKDLGRYLGQGMPGQMPGQMSGQMPGQMPPGDQMASGQGMPGGMIGPGLPGQGLPPGQGMPPQGMPQGMPLPFVQNPQPLQSSVRQVPQGVVPPGMAVPFQ